MDLLSRQEIEAMHKELLRMFDTGVFRESTVTRLERMRDLEENWDGYGGRPIDSDIINRAITLVWNLPIIPEVYPTSNGDIQLEFDTREIYLEFVVKKRCVTMLYVENGNYKNAITAVLLDDKRVDYYVKQFLGG